MPNGTGKVKGVLEERRSNEEVRTEEVELPKLETMIRYIVGIQHNTAQLVLRSPDFIHSSAPCPRPWRRQRTLPPSLRPRPAIHTNGARRLPARTQWVTTRTRNDYGGEQPATPPCLPS